MQEFLKAYNPRGVIKASADGKVEDTGPLTKKRMETIDDETTALRSTSSAAGQGRRSRSSPG
jgi:hypothetical protein